MARSLWNPRWPLRGPPVPLSRKPLRTFRLSCLSLIIATLQFHSSQALGASATHSLVPPMEQRLRVSSNEYKGVVLGYERGNGCSRSYHDYRWTISVLRHLNRSHVRSEMFHQLQLPMIFRSIACSTALCGPNPQSRKNYLVVCTKSATSFYTLHRLLWIRNHKVSLASVFASG